MNNRQKYTQIFQEIFSAKPEELNDSFTFENVDRWDSLTHLTLISELEAAFDVMFETDDILHFGGYMNGFEILKRYGVEF